MCQVLGVTRGNAMPHVSVTIRYHCVDFKFSSRICFLIQFSLYLCLSDSILSQFFLIIKIFYNPFSIRLKITKYKYFYKIKY